jgi:hypothetical protein
MISAFPADKNAGLLCNVNGFLRKDLRSSVRSVGKSDPQGVHPGSVKFSYVATSRNEDRHTPK